MERLSALERELMRSVSALVDGSSKELTALRASLRDYDASVTSNIEARLSGIERVQEALHQRMTALERQHSETWSKLTAILQGFTERLTESEARLSGYESATRLLNEALNRFGK